VFLMILLGMWLTALWLPSWFVLTFICKLSIGNAARKLALVWGMQAVAAVVLILAADLAGLTNPLGYTLAICFTLGMIGAAYAWQLNRIGVVNQKP
jgi:hypothetical protein